METLGKRGNVSRISKEDRSKYQLVRKLALRGVELRIIAKKGGFSSSSSAWSFLDKHGLLKIWKESSAYYKKSKRKEPTYQLTIKLAKRGVELRIIAEKGGFPSESSA